MADMIYNEEQPLPDTVTIIDPMDNTRRKRIAKGADYKDILIPVFRQGHAVYESPGTEAARIHARNETATFHSSIKRFENPHSYPVGLEENLYNMKTQLILKLRGFDA